MAHTNAALVQFVYINQVITLTIGKHLPSVNINLGITLNMITITIYYFRRGTTECGIGQYCTVVQCEKTEGPLSQVPPKKNPSPGKGCDMSAYIGAGTSGTFTFKIPGKNENK